MLVLCVARSFAALRPSQLSRAVGCLLLGYTVLCKQNYALIPLATLLLFKEVPIKVRFLALLPAALYAAFLAFTHAVPDAVVQFASQTSLFEVGVKPYASKWFGSGVLLGVLLHLLYRRFPQLVLWIAGFAVLLMLRPAIGKPCLLPCLDWPRRWLFCHSLANVMQGP
jgi:hypothetical protein